MTPRTSDELVALHEIIARCTVCRDQFRHEIQKPPPIERGPGTSIVLGIGMAPGTSAAEHRVAFAGISFTNIRKWFGEAGYVMSEDELRQRLYLTSLNKCAAIPDSEGNRRRLWQHCRPFLWRQLRLVRPKLVLLFGGEVTRTLIPQSPAGFSEIAGTAWKTGDLFKDELFSPLPIDAHWLAMPHPSGLSRLMNDASTHQRVIASLTSALSKVGFR